METSFASTRGEIFTFTSDRRSLLSAQKLVASLPTFLTDCLLRTDSGRFVLANQEISWQRFFIISFGSLDAAVKLFPHDWIGVVTDGNLFLWRFTHSKDNTVSSSHDILVSFFNGFTDLICFRLVQLPSVVNSSSHPIKEPLQLQSRFHVSKTMAIHAFVLL